jgi:hypothetical protein
VGILLSFSYNNRLSKIQGHQASAIKIQVLKEEYQFSKTSSIYLKRIQNHLLDHKQPIESMRSNLETKEHDKALHLINDISKHKALHNTFLKFQ